MKPVKLGNEKALQITNSLLIRELNNKINSNYNIDIEYKRYHFLDKNRATELKQKEHSFVLNTFGTKYLLFLTHVNFKPYAVYITRKKSLFFLVKTRFSLDLYNDTILEGETVKIGEKWFFLVSDCLVFKGEQMMIKDFTSRYEIITNILANKYISDPYLEPFTLMKKDKFKYEEIQEVKEKYIPSLPFNVNGYLFKCENNASYDILYIFPEFRNKIVSTKDNPSVEKQVKEEETVDEADEKTEATFIMKMIGMDAPDVYEIFIFDKARGKKAKIGYAGIPNISISRMVREWFKDKEDGTELYVKFRKNPVNEKWIPQFVLPS